MFKQEQFVLPNYSYFNQNLYSVLALTLYRPLQHALEIIMQSLRLKWLEEVYYQIKMLSLNREPKIILNFVITKTLSFEISLLCLTNNTHYVMVLTVRN